MERNVALKFLSGYESSIRAAELGGNWLVAPIRQKVAPVKAKVTSISTKVAPIKAKVAPIGP